MATLSYLFMSKKQQLTISSRNMQNPPSLDSSISTDSLEVGQQKNKVRKDRELDDNVDTILVPFYEKDVLMKVPKGQKTLEKQSSKTVKAKPKKEQPHPNYLINKTKSKRTSYLEMFRKQFMARGEPEKPPDDYEISSLLPEYGDTERESIGDDANNPDSDFYNTEAYNDEFYEKLLHEQLSNSLENSFEEQLRFTEDISKTPEENDENNLRSVSEVSHTQQQRHQSRRMTTEPVPNVKLGGLGPDIEHIKPRLERARSLQRYSERVRMENRLRIYKRTIQAEVEKKERLSSAKRGSSANDTRTENPEQKASYLINNNQEQKQQSQIAKKIYQAKCKSAGLLKGKEIQQKQKTQRKEEPNFKRKSNDQPVVEKKPIRTDDNVRRLPGKVSTKSRAQSKCVNTEISSEAFSMPPVQISFQVNVGSSGIARPSSTLKTLEEKHRMYQEQVKAFNLDKMYNLEDNL